MPVAYNSDGRSQQCAKRYVEDKKTSADLISWQQSTPFRRTVGPPKKKEPVHNQFHRRLDPNLQATMQGR